VVCTTFGSVSIETSPPSVVITTRKDKQAQIMSVIQHSPVKSINDIKLALPTIFDIPEGKGSIYITGSIVCPNGKIIFAENHNRRLIILNVDGTFHKEIPCSLSDPFDVTFLDDTTIVVSAYSGIEIINVPWFV
jgi:hypothetical protein